MIALEGVVERTYSHDRRYFIQVYFPYHQTKGTPVLRRTIPVDFKTYDSIQGMKREIGKHNKSIGDSTQHDQLTVKFKLTFKREEEPLF